MQINMFFRTILLLLFVNLNLFAIDGKIKVFITTQESIYTSQKITVAVEILSSAFSIMDARITFPASDKYIIQAPQSASYLGQEEVDGEAWQMVHYDYEIYALKAGKIEIPSVSVSFTASMGYGQPKKEFELKSDALSFDVKVPEGVDKGQFILVTDNFKLSSEVKPEKTKLIVGDAVALSVIQKANGVPDVLLSPIAYNSNESIRVYTKEPLLESGSKGKYDVSRTDRFTFVASTEGNVTLPAQEILWYNTTTQKIHLEKISAIQYEILPDPQIAIDAKKAQQKQLYTYTGIAFLIVLGLYVLLAPKIRHYRKEKKRKYEESEAGIFAHLLTSVASSDTVAVDRQYYLWLLSIAPEIARGGMKAIETIQPSLIDILKEVDLVLIGSSREFDRANLSRELKIFRAKLLYEKQNLKEGLPVEINPL
jgi:hypothetical protein